MQPYAIVKNRSLSLITKAFIATIFTTGLVYINRLYVRPHRQQTANQEMEKFTDEYFAVHKHAKER